MSVLPYAMAARNIAYLVMARRSDKNRAETVLYELVGFARAGHDPEEAVKSFS